MFDKPKKQKIFITPEDVICSVELGWEKAIPFFDAINHVNTLFNAGHEIFFWTNSTDDKILETIKKKLDSWSVSYNDIGMGKPNYTMFIDPDSRILSDRLVRMILNGEQAF